MLLSGVDSTTRLFGCLSAYKVLLVTVTVGPYHPEDGHQKILEAWGAKQHVYIFNLGVLLVIALVFPRELLGRFTGKFVFQLCRRDHKGFPTETVRLTEESSEVICW